MGWRFRKSFSPLPGVRLTLSPSGISTSVGVGPFRVTASPRGPAFTATLPGTGISFRQSLASQQVLEPPIASELPITSPTLPPSGTRREEVEAIQSAGSGSLTTPGLAEFKGMLEQARCEQAEIVKGLAQCRAHEISATGKLRSWQSGLLLRHLFKAKFEELHSIAEEATAHRKEMEEQERLSKLTTQLELPVGVVQTFHRLCDELAVLSKAQKIWDTVGERGVNRVKERSLALKAIDRKAVKFQLSKCVLIESKWSVPHLENANGGDIYFYPAFVLYIVTAESFALLEYKEVQLTFCRTNFIEDELIPPDARVVSSTWAKTNKDGSPDKRFNDNYQIPVVEYGQLLIDSTSGMREEYMISDATSAERFATAWNAHANAVNAGV